MAALTAPTAVQGSKHPEIFVRIQQRMFIGHETCSISSLPLAESVAYNEAMAEKDVQLNDQTAKLYLVLITGVLALIGYVLEVGPVNSVFPVTSIFPTVALGLSLTLPALGFLPYLALAASAAVGLHLAEEEPTPKEEKPEVPEVKPTPEGEMVGERVRVRPELHQLRMVFTALGGYALLKGISVALMWQPAQAVNINLLSAFRFGFFFIALGWLVMWQFLRWYAQRRKWIRLQEELVGGNVTRVVAPIILIQPVLYFAGLLFQRMVIVPQVLIAILLHLTLVAAAALLWYARPLTLHRTVLGLLLTGGAVIILTALQAIVQR